LVATMTKEGFLHTRQLSSIIIPGTNYGLYRSGPLYHFPKPIQSYLNLPSNLPGKSQA
jgi:hypothetical protein